MVGIDPYVHSNSHFMPSTLVRSTMQLDLSSLARKILLVGIAGVILSLFLWYSNRPPGPSDFDIRQGHGSLIGGYGVRVLQEARDNYYQCFASSSTQHATCPIGGNLHLLFWGSILLAAAGGLVLTSLKANAPALQRAGHEEISEWPLSDRTNRASRKTIALYTVASIQVVAGFFGGFFGAFQILEALGFDGYVLIYGHNSLSIDLIVVVAAWCIVLGIGYVASRISSSSLSAPTFYHAIASISFGVAAVLFIHFVVPDIFSYVIDFGTRFFFQSVALVAGYWFGELIRQRRAEN